MRLGSVTSPGWTAHMAIDRFMPILVVDDCGPMIKIVRSQLRQLGFVDVDSANDGHEALAKMRGRRYGLVFSDWHMEPVTGLELLISVRRDPALKQVPFIMVTGESRSENVIAAKKAGVSGYIVKPFDAQMLKAKIEAVFATLGSSLAGRQAVQSQQSSASTSAMSHSDTAKFKFPGRFTSDG